MVETVKITGTICDSHTGNNMRYVDLEVELPMRDLFAAFALAGIIARGHADTELSAAEQAADAYYFADAALAARETNHDHSI